MILDPPVSTRKDTLSSHTALCPSINSPTTSCCLLRCAVIHRRNRLPLHRLAALDRLAIGGVVLEEHRQAVALAELRRVLQVEVQVRFRSEEHTSELQSLMRI